MGIENEINLYQIEKYCLLVINKFGRSIDKTVLQICSLILIFELIGFG